MLRLVTQIFVAALIAKLWEVVEVIRDVFAVIGFAGTLYHIVVNYPSLLSALEDILDWISWTLEWVENIAQFL